MQKQWAQQNADIMAATAPVAAHAYDAPVAAHAYDMPTKPDIYDMPVVEAPPPMTGPRPSPAALLAHAEIVDPIVAHDLPEPLPPTAAP